MIDDDIVRINCELNRLVAYKIICYKIFNTTYKYVQMYSFFKKSLHKKKELLLTIPFVIIFLSLFPEAVECLINLLGDQLLFYL